MRVECLPSYVTDAQLATVGLSPGDVEHVVISHLHRDHAGGLGFFSHATVYVNHRELDCAFSPPAYQAVYYDQRDFDASWKYIEQLEEKCDAQLIYTRELELREKVRLAPGSWYE